MNLSIEKKEIMRVETLPAAKNLLDDLGFFREVFGNPTPKKIHIRQISVHLRKLLIDGQLKAVSAPRCGRIRITIPDNDMIFYNYADKKVVAIGLSRMFDIASPTIDAFTRDEISSSLNSNPKLYLLKGEKPTKFITVDQLLSESVIKYDGIHVNYGDIIKYICYHDFGAHLYGNMNAKFYALNSFRNVISIGLNRDVLNIVIADIDSHEQPGLLLDYPQAILFSIAAYLVNSPEILALEETIRSEI